MKKIIFAAFFLAACGVAYFYVMFSGPHMKVQPHILAYERSMPLPPPGIVTVEPDEKTPPSEEQASAMFNPLPDNEDNRKRGKIYYDYYCVFCHGEEGRGDGPVGNSYMPKPADLHDQKILQKTDGELMRSMLTGVGHEPVMAYVILPLHRWYIVTYVRALGRTY
jgi:mono/diheme cytochrome c family protein